MLAAIRIAQGASSYSCELDAARSVVEPQYEAPRFSLDTYFVLIFLLHLTGLIAFYILSHHRAALEAWHRRRVAPSPLSPTKKFAHAPPRPEFSPKVYASSGDNCENCEFDGKQQQHQHDAAEAEAHIMPFIIEPSRRRDVALLVSIALMVFKWPVLLFLDQKLSCFLDAKILCSASRKILQSINFIR